MGEMSIKEWKITGNSKSGIREIFLWNRDRLGNNREIARIYYLLLIRYVKIRLAIS
jgi:hypothetical protein